MLLKILKRWKMQISAQQESLPTKMPRKNLSSFLSSLFLWNIALTEDENEF